MQNHTDKEQLNTPQTIQSSAPLRYKTTEDEEKNISSLSDKITKDFINVANEMLESNPKETMMLMLEHGTIDVNAKDKYGDTALHHAVKSNNQNDVQILLDQYSADRNITNESGETPLHLAAGENIEITKLLLDTNKTPKKGGNVNAQDINGDTPFHIAARNGNKDICNHLLKMRARWDIRNHDGETVVDVAEDPGFKKHLSDKISKEQRKSDIIRGAMIAMIPAFLTLLLAPRLLTLGGVKSPSTVVNSTIVIAAVIICAGAMIGAACNSCRKTTPALELNDAVAEQPINPDIGRSC